LQRLVENGRRDGTESGAGSLRREPAHRLTQYDDSWQDSISRGEVEAHHCADGKDHYRGESGQTDTSEGAMRRVHRGPRLYSTSRRFSNTRTGYTRATVPTEQGAAAQHL
jgi:hypothetical protein